MDNNPYAFATSFTDPGKGVHYIQEGMTLRDHFAGLAMQAMINAHAGTEDPYAPNTVSPDAYEYADAMLLTRQPKEETND